MICILHGYLLDGSGSNLWTQAIIRTLCQTGETVHLVCQEPHPEKFDYVAQAVQYGEAAEPATLFSRQVGFPGRCILHKPFIGEVLPVYVWDSYEEYEQVIPMVDLSDQQVEDYIRRNVAVVDRVVRDQGITAIHANHAVLMSVVAQQVSASHGIPYAVFPHGSALEYSVKQDPRFFKYAEQALHGASWIFVHGPELRQRVHNVFPSLPGLEAKLVDLHLGVDTGLFTSFAPEQRRDSIEALARSLQGLARGKTLSLSQDLRQRLRDGMSCSDLQQALKESAQYTAKHTDADCGERLKAQPWQGSKVLLFVGRIIASKGLQTVIAALPSILQEEPRTQLVVVGHGPLREAMEALLWALQQGHCRLVQDIIRWGRLLEGEAEESLTHLQRYFDGLQQQGELEQYYQTARRLRVAERVVFTGYLTHQELRYLFPCCDVAIFPSIVPETGPLVFIEALASGVFPMGIDIAGMSASIDVVAQTLPAEVVRLMRLRPDPRHTVADMVAGVLGALNLERRHAKDLRQVAVERYDWAAVGRKFSETLQGR